jgi:hypothetical protein
MVNVMLVGTAAALTKTIRVRPLVAIVNQPSSAAARVHGKT